jgi:hypothetical protein
MENDYRIYSVKQKKYWGPIFWDFLYLTCMGFPVSLSPEESLHFRNLLSNFHVFLPCKDCKNHYKREIEKLNMNIQTKNDAFAAVLLLHNKVRERQKKKLLTCDSIVKYHYRKANDYYYYFYLSITLLLLLVFWWLKLYKNV